MKKLIVALAALSMMGVCAFADGVAPTATQPAAAAQPATATSRTSKNEKRMAKRGHNRRARYHKNKKSAKSSLKKETNDTTKQ